jgi:hypothetical protein
VAIDFSTAAAVPANARRLAARGTHLVIGTTGWQDQEEALRRELAAHPIGVVFAPNFALGVNLFVALAARAAEMLADRPQFGAWIHELHHKAKLDAPSGTAIAIRNAMQGAGYGLNIDVASTRAGAIPGTHTVGLTASRRRSPYPYRARRGTPGRPGGRQVGQRAPRLVFDARCFGVVVGATSHDDFDTRVSHDGHDDSMVTMKTMNPSCSSSRRGHRDERRDQECSVTAGSWPRELRRA